MSHPAELVARIRAAVERDYPPAQYQYVIERAIKGTRMFPDIHVLDPDGAPRCAVEIGYTRPEKLTAYRDKLHIPDVRWYGKDGTLHTSIERRSIVIKVEPGETRVYRAPSLAPCMEDDCSNAQRLNRLVRVEDRYERRFGAQRYDVAVERAMDEACEEVEVYVITDQLRAFYLLFCDACGGACWIDSDESMVAVDSPTELGGRWNETYEPVLRGSWAEVSAWVDDRFGLELDYDQGELFETRRRS